MKKELAIFVFAVLLISSFGNVYSEGSSEGGDDDTDTTNGEMRNPDAVTRINCDDTATFATMRARIGCRIQNRATYVAPANAVPEACRDLRTADGDSEDPQGRCVAYYRVIAPCYNEESPQGKRGCLARASGILHSRLLDETENREQKARDFMVALLYDLEEKLEEKNENGEIDDVTAADGIAQIVDIKRMVLEGKSREEIIPKLRELKVWWNKEVSLLRSVEDNDDAEEDDVDDEEDVE